MDEPLPDWATGHNIASELKEGTQLCTKDGRRTGNARIIYAGSDEHGAFYNCMTDRGNLMVLSTSEIHELFYIGLYFIKDNTQ